MSDTTLSPLACYNEAFGLRVSLAERYPGDTTFLFQLSEAFELLGRHGCLDPGIATRIQTHLHALRVKLGEFPEGLY